MKKQPGTYALILMPSNEKSIKVGKLGLFKLQPGYYVYIGSAFGPGGLSARIAHHQRRCHKPRWHIDYLRTCAEIMELWYTYDSKPMEHQWAKTLAGTRGVVAPFPGFGSSDCNCIAHLYFSVSKPTVTTFRRRLRSRFNDHDRVFTEKIDVLDFRCLAGGGSLLAGK
jgi:Uri superfamily endonuclease